MTSPLLSISNLEVSFKNKEVLKGISLTVQPGEIAGVIGHNGSGKTTLFKTISGLNKAQAGTIMLIGEEPEFPHSYEHLSYIADKGWFYPTWNAVDNLKFFAYPHANQRSIEAILQSVGLEAYAQTQVKHYSFGMTQRLSIARGLLSQARVLLVDEPFNGIDPIGVQAIKTAISKHVHHVEGAAFVSSNSLKEIEGFCSKFLFLKNGVIAESIEASSIQPRFNAYLDYEPSDMTQLQKIAQQLGLQNILVVRSISRAYLNRDCLVPETLELNQIKLLESGINILEDIYFELNKRSC